jgi:hypothetical protein
LQEHGANADEGTDLLQLIATEEEHELAEVLVLLAEECEHLHVRGKRKAITIQEQLGMDHGANRDKGVWNEKKKSEQLDRNSISSSPKSGRASARRTALQCSAK